MIHALIVDDEPLARANLRHGLGQHVDWCVAGECDGAASARRYLAGQPVDVMFLDIQMVRESGLGLARSLRERGAAPAVVFVTAYEQFAIDAFELQAIDYLLKPFDDARLAQTVTRVDQWLHLRRQALETATEGESTRYCRRLTLRSIGHIETVDVQDIRWLSAAGNYVELHLAGRTVLHRVTFRALLERLHPAHFVRTHRSVVVRRDQCAAVSVAGDGVYALRLRCGDVVPVSERYVRDVRVVLK